MCIGGMDDEGEEGRERRRRRRIYIKCSNTIYRQYGECLREKKGE